ncbi:phosphate ABC transporter permease PstA [Nocardioides islandensis]|jgi:phosphate transport system permease protein|uniref:Phosphate transport system permease protein PstA n=1 Tax=Nocardioides islandensis TaxID=433663 RepID=A0A930YFZ7_9ACTN|nr:phosphate ABC transporter permease PstA [Nocardioides islandensis]MBF4765373.1 phosphate ABC transporter permease PstA [Nocardioides islandensis]
MSATTASLTHARLPRWAPVLVAVMALAVAGLPAMLRGWGPVAWVVLAVVLFLVGLPGWSLVVENRRAATDRLMTGLIWAAFGCAVMPLLWLVYVVVSTGAEAINADFLSYSMRGVIGDEQGGVYHALIGTVLITLAATVISVPIGVLTAIYLVEYGAKSRLARWITFLVDVMTGIPSIVAGLFALALVVLVFGPAFRMGLGGSIALSLLMVPTVVRSSEEMFRLVPMDLREAAYALGVPKWRTILKVVVPTSIGGVITGVVLAISRVIGETAPLLVVAGATDGVNFNLFDGRMTTLPVFIFSQYSLSTPAGYERAWGGALVLIVIVMVLNLIARGLGKLLAPPKN